VAHQDLDGVEIDTGLQEVGGEAMAEDVNTAALADAGLGLGLVEDGAGLVVVKGPLGVA